MTTWTAPIIEQASQSSAKPRGAVSALLIIVCFGSAAMGRLVYLNDPFGGDGSMFAYMGKLAAEGGRFGTELVDNKFPTVGFITSIFWRVFGAWWPGYVIVQIAMSLLGAALLARAAGRAFGEHARLATFLPAVVLMNLNAAVMGGFQLETIQAFFACIAGACALEAMKSRDLRDALATGLAGGCAVLIKPTGGAVIGAMVIALVGKWLSRGGTGDAENALNIANTENTTNSGSRNRKLRDLHYSAAVPLIAIAVITGLCIPLAAAGWWLIVSDQLRLVPGIARQIGEYASSTSFDPWDLYRPLSVLLLFAAAMVIRGWVYRRRAVDDSSNRALWLFAIAWLGLELLGVLIQRRMYAYHFLPLAAPAALVFGALPRRVTVGQLAGVLIVPVIFSFWGATETQRQIDRHPPTWPAVTAWLDEHCMPGERIWRDQTMDILLHSDLRPASRVQLTFLFMNSDTAPQRFSGMLLDDLSITRPRFIVLPADIEAHIHEQTSGVFELSRIPSRRKNFTRAWRDIGEYVSERYEPVKTIGDETIWAREPQ